MKYAYVCVAGTFDGMHAGHEALLRKAFGVSSRVLVGLTSDAFVGKHKPDAGVARFGERRENLVAWLRESGYDGRFSIVAIDDPFEPAASSADLEAIVVSEESQPNARIINDMRRQAGLKSLALVVVPMVNAEDARPISATRVRKGEIDSTGRLVLPDHLRSVLAQPLGRILTPATMFRSFESHRNAFVVTVGDLTTKTLLDAGIVPALMVIDHKVERRPFPFLAEMLDAKGFPTTRVASGPGFISREASECIRGLLDRRQGPHVVEIDGEEDLLTLPVIAGARTGDVVYYGQPPIPAWACGPETTGIVEVMVNEDSKREVRGLLNQFSSV